MTSSGVTSAFLGESPFRAYFFNNPPVIFVIVGYISTILFNLISQLLQLLYLLF